TLPIRPPTPAPQSSALPDPDVPLRSLKYGGPCLGRYGARTPPGALPGAPEPAVVRCVVMKGGRSRTTRSGRIPALSFLSALLPSSIYLTRGIVALVESRLQSARGSGEGRICHDHRAARLRGDRHNWRRG